MPPRKKPIKSHLEPEQAFESAVEPVADEAMVAPHPRKALKDSILMKENKEPEEEGKPEQEPKEEEEPEEEEVEGGADEGVEEEGEEEEEGQGMEGSEGDEEEAREVPERIKQRRKQRDFEVFVGGLPRDALEGDLERVFDKVGKVVEVRLAKVPHTNKNKGFAFVRFATVEQAQRALIELKHTKVKGKSCGVLKSNDNETLHLGNICTSWTKDDLVQKLKAFELENLEEVHLIEDPRNKRKNRGYAFLDFSTHMDAVAGCSKLQRRDVYFGTDVRAEVSFSKTVEPDEEVMAQVRSVFLDGLPPSWDEAQVREQFKKFGEIESVQLASHMPTAKRRDFGFISFATRQAALDCIAQVNKDCVGEGAGKAFIKATLKKPLQKRMPSTLGVRRGYIGRSYSGRGPRSYGFGSSYPSRPARSHEMRGFNDRSRAFSSFSSRQIGSKTEMSPPAGEYGVRYTREHVRNVPGSTVSSARSRDPYLESSSSSRHAIGSYRDHESSYSRTRGVYSDAEVYDPRFERHDSYEHPAVSGYKRSYSELERELLASNTSAKHSRNRSDLEIGAYPDHAHDEYLRLLPNERPTYDRIRVLPNERPTYDRIRVLPSERTTYERIRALPSERLTYDRIRDVPNEHLSYDSVRDVPKERLTYDRMDYAGRDNRSRYLSGSGAYRSYY